MATTDETLAAAVTAFEETLFNKFDRLHAAGIGDTEVIHFLRAEGHTVLAARYIEWSGAIDQDAEDDNTTMSPVVPDPADAPSYKPLEEQLAGVQRIREAHAAAFPSLSTPAIDRFLQHARGEVPLPSDRDTLQHQIDALEREYIEKFHHDPEFHAKATMARNFLDQLESVHQLGDHDRSGFLLAALLERGVRA